MGIFIGILEEGLIYAILALGVLITYRILDFPDLTVDSSFPLGAAVSAILTVNGMHPVLTLLMATLAGAAAGLVTGLIHVKCRVRDLLSGIITMTGLYSINLRIAGRANLPFFNMDTLFDNALVDSLPAALAPWSKVLVVLVIVLVVKVLLDLFMNTKAVFDAAAGALLIEFPAENDFAFRAVQKPDVQAELAQALRREAHGDIPFELRKGGASAPMASAPAAASAFNAPAPVAQSVPAPSAASSAASASPMSGAPSSVNAPAVPVPAAAPASSPAPAPDDDRPPYDDYVPYDDADIPLEDPFAARAASPQGAATSPAPSVPANAASAAPSEVPPWEDASQVPAPSGATPAAPASAPAPSPAPSMATPSASALPPEPDAVSGPSPNPVEEPDLAASLAFGFGDGVNFEEVI